MLPIRAIVSTLLALSLPLATPVGVAADVAPGTRLDSSTAEQAKDLLPPEILAHYKNDGYVNPVVAWPVEKTTFPADFKAASEANAGKYKIAPEGHVVDKASGQQPPYILGFPFPTVDPKDPTAGAQIIWNHLYRTWYFGNLLAESQINMLSEKALARRLDVEASFMFFDGLPERERPKENTGNFLVKYLTVVKSPADVNGTAALTWRYREPGKRDASWTYVPALRRVRAISPANRSDGFLGSDFAQDDGNFFEGKPEDFTWKLVGETDQLRLVDPQNLEGKSKNVWTPPNGWNAVWEDIPFIGYMDPQWKGLAWAPRTGALAKRPHWIVEAVPKDRYYLFGKLVMYIDKVSYQGSWDRKFDWKGELLNTYQVMAFNPQAITRPDGGTDYVQGSNMGFQTAEAIKLNRATIAGVKSSPTSMFLLRAPFNEAKFALDSLAQAGK
ncbi:MAG TPA: DUF1329 domain-containing protein [Candidatus Limnocylindria bacterium]|nr:DUF1329 domain-containing protein [Candidatus Limnocylindria bacterium]